MFNLYAVLTSHDTVTDVGRASTFRRIFNSRSLQTKSTKIEGSYENMGFNGKPVWRFQTVKKNRNNILDLSEKPNGKQRTLHVSIDHGPRKQ